ncbi:MAG: polysaccharide pyruvyl transferase family protein [Eubacterium sp.]|nr:polysaccharide pyruvyl transferase family protein [Eubacterium sp.]
MKVYTVTYLSENYGSVLQAYALQQAIKSCGAEPVILKKNPVKRTIQYRAQGFIKPRENYTLFMRLKIRLQGKKYKLKKEKVHRFIDQYITTEMVNSTSEIISTLQTDDLLLAGSDQIWTMLDAPISEWYTFHWDNLPADIKKYSYAASIGVSVLSEDEKKQYQDALSDFNIISFRERQTYELLKDRFKQPVRCDIDPTLLFNGDYWKCFAQNHIEKEPYIFVYMLRPDKELIRQSIKLAKKLHCRVIYTGKMADKFFGVKTVYDAGIEDYLSYIAHAEAVVTNSFHGTVFSILFQKQFASVRIATTSSRAENLLNLTGLEDRFANDDEIVSVMEKPINYREVFVKLDAARQDSLRYIRRICQQRG